MLSADDLLEELACWAADLPLEDIPPAVRALARTCITDTAAVGFAGARLAISARVCDWAVDHYRAGPAGVMNRETSFVAPAAALVNAVACHALDFDDTCYEGIVHASAVVLPAALACCDSEAADGASLLLAYCVGCQVEVELGRYFTNDLYSRGWLNTALLGTFGAAAAAAKSLGLRRDRFRTALALAAVEAAGIRAVLGSEAKPWLAGRAAETGVRCALLARAGVTGPLKVLDGPNGFIDTHLGDARPPPELNEVGTRWAFSDPGFALKLYPVCSAAQAAAEIVQGLYGDAGVRVAEIRRITVGGSALVVRSLRHAQPRTVQEAQFSMPFALACILRHGRLGPEELRDEVILDPMLRAMMSNVSLVEDPELEGCLDGGVPCPEPARVRVELQSGEIIERTRLAASGMPQCPFTHAQQRAKFATCLNFAGWLSPMAERLFDRLECLGKAEKLPGLFSRPAAEYRSSS